MKMFFFGLCILLAIMSLEVNAQFKPSEQQYLGKNNIAINGGFEQGKKGWTNANGTFNLSDTDQVNGKYAGCVTLAGETLDFSQTLSTGYNSNLATLDGIVSAFHKASGFNYQVCPLVDGVEVACQNAFSDLSYNWKQIPTTLGSTSLGIKFKTSGNVTGTLCVDGVEFGAKQNSFKAAQAQVIGSFLLADNDCVFDKSTQPYGKPTAATSNCLATNITGNVTQPDTTSPTIRVPNAQVGTYEVSYDGMLYNLGNAGSCYFSVSTSSAYENQGVIYSASTPENRVSNTVAGIFDVTSAGDIDFSVISSRGATSTTCRVYGTTDLTGKFVVKYYPPSETIVGQQQIKNVENSNEFKANVTTTSGTVASNEFDFIASCTAANPSVCTFSSDFQASITVAPKCEATVNQFSAASPVAYSESTTGFTLYTFDTSGVATGNIKTVVTCTKSDPDYNKSLLIVGTFEQIKTTDLCKVVAYTNDDDIISATTEDIPWKTKEYDNCNLWSNAGNTDSNTNDAYTARQDGFITASGIFFADSASAGTNNITVYKNGSVTTIQCGIVDNTAFQTHFSCIIPVAKNDVITFRSAILKGLTVSAYHRITIMEEPDLAGIVKNLNDDRNVKCQQKNLSINEGLGTIPDFTFNNLVIGKKYEYNTKIIGYNSNTANNIKTITLRILNGATVIGAFTSTYQSEYARYPVLLNKKFTASSDTMTVVVDGVDNMTILASVFGENSFVELCELPSNYTTTTEF